MPLSGKTIVLTGGAGDIGRLVARGLVEAGASLHIVDRVVALSLPAIYSRADLSTREGIAAAAGTIRAEAPDVLINLAGVQYFGPFEDQAPADLATSIMVNLLAPMLLTHAALPQMKGRGRGHIVNIGSVFGSIGFANFATYSGAKAGLRGFSEALRRELDGTGIDVTYIAPRAVKTALCTERVLRYAELTKMVMDAPERTARRIVEAVIGRKKDVYIGFPESIFVRVNAIFPRVVDAAVVKNDRKARKLFNSPAAPKRSVTG